MSPENPSGRDPCEDAARREYVDARNDVHIPSPPTSVVCELAFRIGGALIKVLCVGFFDEPQRKTFLAGHKVV
jgi:hypothetical protein